MKKDFFAHKASGYDKSAPRVNNVANIANAIFESVDLKSNMHLMDFGSGTGLLLEQVAPKINKMTAVDVSPSMSAQLSAKADSLPCELEMLQMDLTTEDLDQEFDGIISSMTMHHIENIDAMFSKFYNLLKNKGFIAIADLEKEDGSFHTEDTGVFHHGFEPSEFAAAATRAGFKKVEVKAASIIARENADYPIFLLVGEK